MDKIEINEVNESQIVNERVHRVDGVYHITYKALPYPLPPEWRTKLKAVFDDEKLRTYVTRQMQDEIGMEITRKLIPPVDRVKVPL